MDDNSAGPSSLHESYPEHDEINADALVRFWKVIRNSYIRSPNNTSPVEFFEKRQVINPRLTLCDKDLRAITTTLATKVENIDRPIHQTPITIVRDQHRTLHAPA